MAVLPADTSRTGDVMSQTYQEMRVRRAEFATRLNQLLREFHDIAGPQIDPVTEKACDHDRDETCACRLPETCMMTEYVLLTNWSDLSKTDDDADWSCKLAMPGMTTPHQRGLLFTFLH